ncbi:MAG: type II secretion system GspH family protein [Proteobacteria bacterium]|nr:type II secretion system GspH family protein [Pseudomonadota bacterium]
MTPEKNIYPKMSQHGFTLLEIIVSLIVASILGSMLLVYVGTAYNKSIEPVATSKRVLQLEHVMEDINAIYAGLLDRADLLDAFNDALNAMTLPAGVTCDSSKRFDFSGGAEPDISGASSTGNILKVVLRDTTVHPNLELIALFYNRI